MLTESFRNEAFIQIGEHTSFSGFAELLLTTRDDAEKFFSSASNPEIHEVFSQAVRNSVGRLVTINIQPSALFDPNFLSVLMHSLEDTPETNRHNFCIEITEHGGVPENFDPRLLAFLKEIGLKLALDDFDPRYTDELNRLNSYGPHMDIIKFPYQVMEALRNPETRADMSDKIRSICERYLDKAFVMEGVGENEPEVVKNFLRDLGIDYIQISAYQTRIQSAPTLALVA